MKYKMVESGSAQQLSEQVTALLAQGWILYGNPVVSTYVTDNAAWYLYGQAVIRND